MGVLQRAHVVAAASMCVYKGGIISDIIRTRVATLLLLQRTMNQFSITTVTALTVVICAPQRAPSDAWPAIASAKQTIVWGLCLSGNQYKGSLTKLDITKGGTFM